MEEIGKLFPVVNDNQYESDCCCMVISGKEVGRGAGSTGGFTKTTFACVYCFSSQYKPKLQLFGKLRQLKCVTCM